MSKIRNFTGISDIARGVRRSGAGRRMVLSGGRLKDKAIRGAIQGAKDTRRSLASGKRVRKTRRVAAKHMSKGRSLLHQGKSDIRSGTRKMVTRVAPAVLGVAVGARTVKKNRAKRQGGATSDYYAYDPYTYYEEVLGDLNSIEETSISQVDMGKAKDAVRHVLKSGRRTMQDTTGHHAFLSNLKKNLDKSHPFRKSTTFNRALSFVDHKEETPSYLREAWKNLV